MPKTNTLLKFFILFLITSCSKENEENAFFIDHTFQTENSASVGPVRVFTRNGEITDTVFIREFIIRNTTGSGLTNYFLFNTHIQQVDPTQSLKITIRENNTARIERYFLFAPTPMEIHEAEFTYLSPSELLFIEKDTVVSSFFSNQYCWDMALYNILKPFPQRICAPAGTGYETCRWRHSFSLEISGQQLMLPMVLSMAVNGGNCITTGNRDQWKSFNPAIISTLQANDTIAFQAKKVLLRRL